MLRSVLSRAVMLFVLHCAIFGVVHATNVIVPHQGRLLDADDKPVSGTLDITYRIYDAPTAGTMLWSEIHPSVSVLDGLFDALMGTITPLPTDVFRSGAGGADSPPRWLEVQVGAVVLSPRMQLGSVPRAAIASGISGDILTNKGLAEVRDFSSATEDAIVISSHDGDNHLTLRCLNGLPPGEVVIGTLSMATTPSSSSLDIGDLDGDGLYQVLATSDSVTRELTFADNGPGGATLMKAKEKASRTKCSSNLRSQSPFSTSEFDEICDFTRSTAKAITTKGTGAIASVKMDAGDSATVSCDHDLDGDGEPENFVHSECSEGGASLRVISLNGLPPGVPVEDNIAINANGSSSTVALAKGVAKVGLGVAGAVGIPGGAVISSRCLSPNGLDTASTEQSSDGSGSALRAINTKGTGATVRVMSLASDSGLIQTTNDPNGDGNPECAAEAKTNDNYAQVKGFKVDIDGARRSSFDNYCDSAGSIMRAINTKGTGATLRVAATANDSGAVGTDCDDDADGFSERATWTSSNPSIARSVVAADLDSDGDYDNVAMQSCDATSSRMESSSSSGSGVNAKSASLTVSASPGGSACRAINTDGHGMTVRSMIDATDAGDAHILLEADTDGDAVLESSLSGTCDSAGAELTVKVKDGAYHGHVTTLKGIARMAQMTTDGDGYFDGHLGVGMDATHRIDIAGGAYCDGTNWVNASDKNAKENFQEVDGKELLGKIAELDITKWNYKSDKETEHIGPTAQDFNAAFGVGSDGKSISTIDPSGIALAAIKELYSQLKAKDKEIADLRNSKDKDMKELREEMAKLRKELQKK